MSKRKIFLFLLWPHKPRLWTSFWKNHKMLILCVVDAWIPGYEHDSIRQRPRRVCNLPYNLITFHIFELLNFFDHRIHTFGCVEPILDKKFEFSSANTSCEVFRDESHPITFVQVVNRQVRLLETNFQCVSRGKHIEKLCLKLFFNLLKRYWIYHN